MPSYQLPWAVSSLNRWANRGWGYWNELTGQRGVQSLDRAGDLAMLGDLESEAHPRSRVTHPCTTAPCFMTAKRLPVAKLQ